MLTKGTVLEGKYKILDVIGQGGMSVVYMAIVESANKIWAVKEIRKDGKNDYNVVQQNLIAEIETLKSVKHPKLPEIADVIPSNDSFIIIMDYIEGRSLADIWKEEGAQTEETVIEWGKQLCDVMGYLHSKGIVYRDMKPSNVMLQPNGEVTIIDFGTAKKYVIDSGETTGLGTAGYAAPEQYGGMGHTDARTDIYALGMTMYALLTGVNPETTYVESTSIRQRNPMFSDELDQIIQKCTQRAKDDRYQSCAELLYDLEHTEEVGRINKKKAAKKLAVFSATLLLSAGCMISGQFFNQRAKMMASDNYTKIIDDAALSTQYSEKIELYEQAMNVPNKAGEADAYLAMLQAFKTNDGDEPQFTNEEAERIEKLIISNRSELEKNKEGYVEICYEMGKMFWYYYQDENQVTRAKYSIEWFQIVTDRAAQDYENIGLATVYKNIGIFYRDITANVNEASDNGMYNELLANIWNLMDTVAVDEDENEIVRLELLEMARSALHQYSNRFKRDGVTYEELNALYNKINEVLESIYVPEDPNDKAYTRKITTSEMMDETKTAIDTAYSTSKEAE